MVLRNLLLPAAFVGITALTPVADARPPRDREQDAALRALQEGRIMPLRAIEGMIVPRMRGFEDIKHYTVDIHRLENDGDRLERSALASLFEQGIDPMVVIRWKDIFERLEEAVDATEKVANILSGIVIKNS